MYVFKNIKFSHVKLIALIFLVSSVFNILKDLIQAPIDKIWVEKSYIRGTIPEGSDIVIYDSVRENKKRFFNILIEGVGNNWMSIEELTYILKERKEKPQAEYIWYNTHMRYDDTEGKYISITLDIEHRRSFYIDDLVELNALEDYYETIKNMNMI